MINVTSYCKAQGIFNENLISNFKRMQRIKPFLTPDNISIKLGRYGGTFMSEDLFDIFKTWVRRKPLPLINRQEKDVLVILQAVYKDLDYQFKVDNYIYDFYIPSYNLLIEYDESHHNQSSFNIKKTKAKKTTANDKGFYFACIKENSAPQDIAEIINLYYPVW